MPTVSDAVCTEIGTSMATMADVAERAGVTLSTVSYVLSGKRSISAATTQRVLDAIAELDFQPNQLGRALAQRRSNTIALLFPALIHGIGEQQLEFVTSAAETASQHGFAFLLSISPEEETEVGHLAQRGFVDGLILMAIKLQDPRVELLRQRRFPFAMIGHCANNDGISFVDLDFVHAVREALRYLAGLGHRRVAFLGNSDALMATGYGPAVRTFDGFEAGTAEYGIEGTWHPCDPSPQAAYTAVEQLLRASPDVTALVTAHHDATAGIVRAARDTGRRIPDNLSLVAITTPRQAEALIPALTTMDIPAAEMGRLGVELLIRQLEAEGGETEPIHQLLRARLTVRQSSGPAPGHEGMETSWSDPEGRS
jgi:DNA-binding LacI/PurR family transcriptional regulator